MEETLGKRIVQHRKQLGMTQDQLAEKLGVTAQAVSKWENDQSCPDITMLPRLAELFGTTTDALLGHQPVYDAQVVTEEQPEEKEPKRGWEMHWDGGRREAVGFAVLVLLIGGLMLAAELLSWNVSFWGIAWPSALLVYGLMRLTRRFNFTGIACALLGGYFLLDNLEVLEKLNIDVGGSAIIAALILLFGLCLLMDAFRKPRKSHAHVHKNGGEKKSTSTLTTDGERFNCSLSFAEARREICLPRLSEGDISCSFGELTVDLTGCDEIADGCSISVGCSFGELELIVPKAYRVQCQAGSSFGGIHVHGEPDSDPKGVISLTGGVSFGEMSICYV